MSPRLLNDALRVYVISLAVVFMGSNKYKGENTFDSFLSRHGGQVNACTDYEKVHVCMYMCRCTMYTYMCE